MTCHVSLLLATTRYHSRPLATTHYHSLPLTTTYPGVLSRLQYFCFEHVHMGKPPLVGAAAAAEKLAHIARAKGEEAKREILQEANVFAWLLDERQREALKGHNDIVREALRAAGGAAKVGAAKLEAAH